MKIYGIFSKKALLPALLAALLTAKSCFVPKNADGASERRAYLLNLGISVDADTEQSKTVLIPDNFGAVYGNYNMLQKAAGFDLSLYKGCTATLYTYQVTSGDRVRYNANLLVYNGRVIGGDLSSAALDGQMVPLIKKEIKKCLK